MPSSACSGLAAWVPPANKQSAASIVGIEHEYYLTQADKTVDFRTIMDTLGLQGRRIDPADNRAYRLDSGHVITYDDNEAECVIAPVNVEPDFTEVVDLSCRAVAGELLAALPPSIQVRGASTHVSVSCPDAYARRVVSMIAAHFTPALMLLADDSRSYGILVRPRYQRVELGLDYVSGPGLRALTAMAAGAVLLCFDVLTGAAPSDVLPPRLQVKRAPAQRRFGLYVSRRSFGVDLYKDGRDATLALLEGGTIRAGRHIELAWKAVRPALSRVAGPGDLRELDDAIVGLTPLPVETDKPLDIVTTDQRVQNAFASITRPVVRPGFTASAVMLSWDLAVLVVSGSRRAYMCVPRSEMSQVALRLRDGSLDEPIVSFLSGPDRGTSVPSYPRAVRGARLYDNFHSRSRLITPERELDGRLELDDGSLLVSPTLPPPAPGTWLSAAPGSADHRDQRTSAPVSSESLASLAVDTDRRGLPPTKRPVPPGSGSVPPPGSDDGTTTPPGSHEGTEEPPRGSRLSWMWIAAAAAGALVIVGMFLAGLSGTDVAEPDSSAVAPPPSSTAGVAPSSTAGVAPTSSAPPADSVFAATGVDPDDPRIRELPDDEGDFLDSISTQTPTFVNDRIDIESTIEFVVTMTQAEADAVFNFSTLECGETEPLIVVCPLDVVDVPAGEILAVGMTLHDDAPTGDTDHSYIYAAVFDSDDDPANDWVFNPPFDYDLFQGADRWYQLMWSHLDQRWWTTVTQFDSRHLNGGRSGVRVVVNGNRIIFLVPRDEIGDGAYRLTAFAHDGDYSVDDRGADVSGTDPTQPLTIVTAEPIAAQVG